jgi:hypothetical protein
LYAGAERAFIQQNQAAMLFLLFCFCQLFDLFECHGQPLAKDYCEGSNRRKQQNLFKIEAN